MEDLCIWQGLWAGAWSFDALCGHAAFPAPPGVHQPKALQTCVEECFLRLHYLVMIH